MKEKKMKGFCHPQIHLQRVNKMKFRIAIINNNNNIVFVANQVFMINYRFEIEIEMDTIFFQSYHSLA